MHINLVILSNQKLGMNQTKKNYTNTIGYPFLSKCD